MTFLPYDKKTMAAKNWDAPDFVLVTGDAYVDHPSFGAAIIGRVLEQSGFRVAILSQPQYTKTKSFMTFGLQISKQKRRNGAINGIDRSVLIFIIIYCRSCRRIWCRGRFGFHIRCICREWVAVR